MIERLNDFKLEHLTAGTDEIKNEPKISAHGSYRYRKRLSPCPANQHKNRSAATHAFSLTSSVKPSFLKSQLITVSFIVTMQ